MVEEPPPQENEQDRLKWRGNPLETFSDWRIEVIGHCCTCWNGKEDPEKLSCCESCMSAMQMSKTFHVHKFARPRAIH